MYGLSAYYLIAPAEASSNLARYDGVRYGLRVDGDDVAHDERARRATPGFGPEVKRRIMLGTYALSAGYYDAYYGQAQRVRTLIIRDFARAYEQFDALLSPTSPTVAFELGRQDRRPARDVPLRRLHDSHEPRRPRRDQRAVRHRRAGLAGRRAGARAGAGRSRCMFRVARVLERVADADGAGMTAIAATTEYEAGHRPRGARASSTTATKLFCGCANEFGAEPNTHVCPVCLGLPGSLPVLNEQAVEFALRFAEALDLARARGSRSSPGRTTSIPTCRRTIRSPSTTSRSRSTAGSRSTARASASSARTSRRTPASPLHVGGGGRIHDADHSLVDYNRAGVPLMEIVSRPDIRTRRAGAGAT